MIQLEKKSMINLQKEAGIVLQKLNLDNIEADLYLVIDRSGSMDGLFRDGTVQSAAERVLALASKWDKDQQVPVIAFNWDAQNVGTMVLGQHEGWINRNVGVGGGTNYAPAIKAVVELVKDQLSQVVTGSTVQAVTRQVANTVERPKSGLFGKLFGGTETVTEYTTVTENVTVPQTTRGPIQLPAARPAYVLFITDGANGDRPESERALIEASNLPIFFQFIGIGNEHFDFLERLDTMPGRKIDNANFFQIAGKVSDDELYQKMLVEFPGYLGLARNAGLLA